MTYQTRSAMERNSELRGRITACAWQEGVSQPPRWVAAIIGRLIGDDWVAAWESALAGGMAEEDIGASDVVVTDQMILSAVQAALQAQRD